MVREGGTDFLLKIFECTVANFDDLNDDLNVTT